MKKNNINANGEPKESRGKLKYRKIPSQKFLYEIAEDGTIRNVKSKKTYSKLSKADVERLVAECWGIENL